MSEQKNRWECACRIANYTDTEVKAFKFSCPSCGGALVRWAPPLPVAEQSELRDRFAMAALTGLISGGGIGSTWDIATLAYRFADAMEKSRKPVSPEAQKAIDAYDRATDVANLQIGSDGIVRVVNP